MRTLSNVIKRNLKMFFKDKGMFFTSLITPLILLVLYATFLAKVYRDSFAGALPEGFTIEESLLNSTVVCQLISSLLAVSCVTVSFCSNLLMVGDRATKSIKDFNVSPVKSSTMAIGYYVAAAISTLIVTLTATAVCFGYLTTQGWYLSAADVFLVILDVILVTLFGVALSSPLFFFLKTNGQASAVGTIVSAGYGFVCGAYMPISNFSAGLQKTLMFLPGTYGTSLIRNHMMRGVFNEMSSVGFPDEVVEGIRDSIDCNIYFFDHKVSVSVMYAVVIGSILLFTGLFVLFHVLTKNRKAK